MQVSRGIVVATIQDDLEQAVLARLRDNLLSQLEKSGCQGVILDLSGLHTLDAAEFDAILQITAMIRVMGATPVLSGLRAGVVSALIDTGIEVGDIQAAVDLDAAFELLLPASTAEPDEAAGADDETETAEAEQQVPGESS